MTWPGWIATAIGVIAAAMIWASQHGLGTRTTPTPQDPPDGEPP
ncbi:hypothetical protein ACPB9J_33315 [Streptomyces lavendulocolor]